MYYFSKFFVGSPEMEQSAIIDTGSDTLAFPCSQCPAGDCGTHQDPIFFTKQSKTFHFDMRCSSRSYIENIEVCRFTKSYAEGSSLSGFKAEDYVRFKNAKVVQDNRLRLFNSNLNKDLRLKAEFGCITKEDGLFKTQFADGILGLDDNSKLIESLEEENSKQINKVFSFGLCFHSTGGIMSIDLRNRDVADDKIVMLNKSIHKYSEPITVPYNSLDNYYNIRVTGFELANRKIKVPSVIMMVDSGTTFSHFPNLHLDKIFSYLNDYCRRNRDKCGKLPRPEFTQDTCLELKLPDKDYSSIEALYASFPPITIYFSESRNPYVLYPQNYWYKEFNPISPNNKMKICMALKGNEDGKIILGAFSMIDYYFYFDRKDKTLKIFKEDCYLRTTQLLARRRDRILSAQTINEKIDTDANKLLNVSWVLLGILIFIYLLSKMIKRQKTEEKLADLPIALSKLVNCSPVETCQ